MQYCMFYGNGENFIVEAETIWKAYEIARSKFDNPEFVKAILESAAKEMIKRGVRSISE